MKKNKQGYYRRHITINGKNYYIKGRTKEELAKNEKNLRERIKNDENSLSDPSMNEYYEYFTKIREGQITGATLCSQLRHFKLMSEVKMKNRLLFGQMRIKEITGVDLEYVRRKLLDMGKSPEHLNVCFSHLKTVFKHAEMDGTIERNPSRAMKPFKSVRPSVSNTIHRALSEEETKAFFAKAQEKESSYLNCYKIMIKTGLRVGEVTALNPDDIDWKKKFIHINKTVVRNEIGGYEIGKTTKTDAGLRDIPLTEELEEIIKDQIEKNKKVFRDSPNNLIFRSADDNFLREYTINRDIKRICSEAGVEYFTTHCFRNTFATRFIEQQPQDYKILSTLLGHKDISITLNLYTHVMKENLVKSFNKIQVVVD